MITTNITDYQDSVKARRSRRAYSKKQEEPGDDRVYMTPEIMRLKEEAERECREGRCVTLRSHEEIDKFFESFL